MKLLTPILAARPNSEKNPEFRRKEFVRLDSPDGNVIRIQADLARWRWAFMEARDALEMEDVSVDAILPRHYYCVRRTITYHRKFRRGKEMVRESYEALPSGQVVTWEFTLARRLPPATEGGGQFVRPPDESEFDRMLEHIGDRLGMTEWGQAYLYGRFKIHKHALSDSTRRGGADSSSGHARSEVVPDNAEPDNGEGTRPDQDGVSGQPAL